MPMISGAAKSRIEIFHEEYLSLASENEEALLEIALSEIPESVYNSNAIEKSTLTLEDTEDILIRNEIRKDNVVKEIYEAKNLAEIMERLIKNTGKDFDVTDPEEIKRLHEILFTRIDTTGAGRFRGGKEWVRVGAHLGANPAYTNELVFELVEKFNNDKESYFLDKIAGFHAEFEMIHPFMNGNGRIGRAVVNGQLMRLGYPPIIIPNKSKQKEYLSLFDDYRKTGKSDGLSQLFALLLMESMHKRIAIITSKKVIFVGEWAKECGLNIRSALNMAKKQRIPAFRLRGKWMIDEAYLKR